MAINFPSLKQVLERSRSDLRNVLPRLDPSKPKSFIRAIIDSNSGRAYDGYTLLRQMLLQFFPQTAVDPYLSMWGGYNNLEARAAQSAMGYVVITGTALTEIPAGTLYNSIPGNQYVTLETVTLDTIGQSLVTAVADGSRVVTCTVAIAHQLATGVLATFTGLTNSADTVDAAITVLSATSFSFVAPDVSTTGSVLGTGAYSFVGAKVEVESDEPGSDKNLGSGSILSIVSPISGADPEAYVDFSGLLGGTDVESEESFRQRILDRRSNPVANFNVAAIETQATIIPAVTKVFVSPVTPYAGAVTIYFFVEDGESQRAIPNPSQVAQVLESILEIKPVTTEEADVIVAAPNVVAVSHVIDGLSPNTQTLKDAIDANLEAFYEDTADLGLDITVDMLRNVIQNTQDLVTGEFPLLFDLTTPATTTVIDTDEIATYGSTSYT